MNNTITGTQSKSIIGLQFEELEKHHLIATKFIPNGNGYTGISTGIVGYSAYGRTILPEAIVQPTTESNIHIIDLVYEKSGLNWIELSALIGVNVRSIHFWRQDRNQMSLLNESILTNLNNLLTTNSNKTKFGIRNILLSEILENKSTLLKIQSGDQEIWTYLNQRVSQLNEQQPLYNVSNEAYLAKMPTRPEKLLNQTDIVRSKKAPIKARSLQKLKRYKRA